MSDSPRIISPQAASEDIVMDRAIRPKRLQDYVGQPVVREQMGIFIDAARARSEALDHVLIFDRPTGKTTLAHIIANEMGLTCARPPVRCWKTG